MDRSSIKEMVKEAAQDPKSASIDGIRVEQHGLGDVVAAARYLKDEAAAADPFSCLRKKQVRIVDVP